MAKFRIRLLRCLRRTERSCSPFRRFSPMLRLPSGRSSTRHVWSWRRIIRASRVIRVNCSSSRGRSEATGPVLLVYSRECPTLCESAKSRLPALKRAAFSPEIISRVPSPLAAYRMPACRGRRTDFLPVLPPVSTYARCDHRRRRNIRPLRAS